MHEADVVGKELIQDFLRELLFGYEQSL